MLRTFTLALSVLLVHTTLTADAFAITRNEATRPRETMKVAATLARLGAGADSLVALRLRNKSVLKGRLEALQDDAFVVKDTESGVEHIVLYSQVARLQGVNLASGTQVRVGGGFRARLASAASFLLPVRHAQVNNLTGGEKTLLIGIVIGVLLAIVLAKTS